MTENSNKRSANDFVAKDIKYDRICVSGKKDNFTAIKCQGKWEKGYPEFEDLMDNFSEEKDLSEIQKFSSEARSSF
ncbi:hypothetical protein FVR03_22245 [Pontibacter qinzhouensis]|uniref:Uncharacterized protein n=1 Tax=Pontibacter qinzhouensis TaxID=2603253 RepID=A0A5C8IVH0_9BACT|nr:hypothetical protein [Pontibacter qinzhouensis]TXK24832.1 hypothetical protein FVR03_22245 [Pontibacter qinzhouensis]